MILVVGATGLLGGEICRILKEKNLPVRAMVRESSNPEKIRGLKGMGVEILQGDLRKSTSLPPVLKGISHVIITASSIPFSYMPGENDPILVDRNGINSLIYEAGKERVEHIVYTSFSGNIRLKFPLSLAKRNVENHLMNSGIKYTILRPGFFMETWLTNMVGFDVENAKAQIFGDGNNPVSYISYKDVAWFAVESLTNTAAWNAVLELGGPEQLSQLDVVNIFEKVLHRKFDLQYLPQEIILAQMKSAKDPMQKSFSGLMYCMAEGDPIDMSKILREFRAQLTSVIDYAESLIVAV